jgi:acyl-CoA thioesterase
VNNEFQTIRDCFEKDRYAKLTGIELVDFGKGWAQAKLVIQQKHLNIVDTVQGGVIYTLADFAFEVASNSYGDIAMGIETHLSFFKAVASGTLVATAKEVSFHPKLAHYTVEVVAEGDDEVIAKFDGTVYRKKKPLTEIPKNR